MRDGEVCAAVALQKRQCYTPPIDAVVTWVDTTDQLWVQQYNRIIGDFSKNAHWTPDAGPEAELSVCLELIRRNMPWVRNTYIVTMRPQKPACLQHEQVVHHDEIGLGTVFNSHSIETALHKIPGLAEHFLYLNDDFYVMRPVTPRHFFTCDMRPLVRRKPYLSIKTTDPHLILLNKTSTLTGTAPILLSHTPYALTRSLGIDFDAKHEVLMEATRACPKRGTCEGEIAPITAILSDALRKGSAVRIFGFDAWFSETLRGREVPRRATFACVNSLDVDEAELRRKILRV